MTLPLGPPNGAPMRVASAALRDEGIQRRWLELLFLRDTYLHDASKIQKLTSKSSRKCFTFRNITYKNLLVNTHRWYLFIIYPTGFHQKHPSFEPCHIPPRLRTKMFRSSMTHLILKADPTATWKQPIESRSISQRPKVRMRLLACQVPQLL